MIIYIKETRKRIDNVETGRAARTLRKSHSISLRALAEAMGISQPYLSDLELGRRNWSKELGERFQEELNKLTQLTDEDSI